MAQLWAGMADETQRLLLEAALAEFSERGYELASTNQITRRAGVSKGLLFHYFKSKKNLFLLIVEECTRHFFAYLEQHKGEISPDPLQRIADINRIVIRLFREAPWVMDIAFRALLEKPRELLDEMTALDSRVFNWKINLLMEGMDRSRLRVDINQDKVLIWLFLSVVTMSRQYVIATREQPDRGLELLDRFYVDLSEHLALVGEGLYSR